MFINSFVARILHGYKGDLSIVGLFRLQRYNKKFIATIIWGRNKEYGLTHTDTQRHSGL